MSDKNKIYLIGAGNLGLHLAKALKKTSYEFTGVFSRQPQNASMAAEILQCKAVDNLYNIPDNTEIIIISVPDSILIEIAKKLKAPEHIVIHTSGSVEMNILKQISPAYGVIYPLQTFSKKREISFNNLDVFVEASDNNVLRKIYNMLNSIGANPHLLNSEKRAILHLAAVFACNYTNFMIYNAEKILEKYSIPREYLYPLIKETVLKAIEKGARDSQTGPAIRGDKIIIDKHLKLLSDNKLAKPIYELLSSLILKEFGKD